MPSVVRWYRGRRATVRAYEVASTVPLSCVFVGAASEFVQQRALMNNNSVIFWELVTVPLYVNTPDILLPTREHRLKIRECVAFKSLVVFASEIRIQSSALLETALRLSNRLNDAGLIF